MYQLQRIVLIIIFFVLASITSKAQWIKSNFSNYLTVSDSLKITAFAVIDNNIFASKELDNLYMSSNKGFIWNPISFYFNALAVKGNNLYGGNNAILLSTDFGNSWSVLNKNTSIFDISSLAVEGDNIYAGTFFDGIWMSTDNGASFVHDTNGINKTNEVNTILISGTNVLAGTNSSGIYLSSNNGMNWIQSNNGLTNLDVHTLISSFGNILAGTDNGVFLSSDNGADWVQVNNGLTDSSVYSFASAANYVFAGTNNGGIFATTNYGGKWISIADSLTSYNISALALSGSNIIAGSSNGLLWYRTVANMFTTDVNDKKNNVPDKYSLYQNYPNPFNPSTMIKYQIPKSGLVQLKVYDILGREVAAIVNEFQTEGEHSVRFSVDNIQQTTDHEQLSSGVYFYQLKAGDYTAIRKMVLLK